MSPLTLLAGGMLVLVAFGFIDTDTGHLDLEHADAAFSKAGDWLDRFTIMMGVMAVVVGALVAVRRGWLSWDMLTGGGRKVKPLPGDFIDPSERPAAPRTASESGPSSADKGQRQ